MSNCGNCSSCKGGGCSRCINICWPNPPCWPEQCPSPCIPICPPQPTPPPPQRCGLPVYGSVSTSQSRALPVGTTTIVFPLVAKQSQTVGGQNVYNTSTGIFTTPQYGDAMYTLTAHLGFSVAENQQNASIHMAIVVNGSEIVSTDDTITTTNSVAKWYDLTRIYPLTAGQMVSVIVTPSAADVFTPLVNSSFSFMSGASI